MLAPTRPRSTVLIVDDMPSNIEVLLAALDSEHELRIATSGRQALTQLARGELPDVILLDLMMPGMDGYAVCAELKRDPRTRDIPVIFVTAQIDAASEAQALAAGAVDFIHKPIHALVVRARLRLHLELERRTRALAAANAALAQVNGALEQANGALEQANVQLEALARHDALTGLANRRAADERLHDEFMRARRLRIPYAVLMIDIDHFKRVNDQHGHAVGDAVLRHVAQHLRTALRETDFLSRFGGEEFLALLPATTRMQACQVADKVRRLIEQVLFEPVGTLTASIGVALSDPAHVGEAQAVQLADNALYRAKELGRNRVEIA
ncbi:MAG: diguanylate cyclase [Leptothrix sp. (in: b-proteobacteria)]